MKQGISLICAVMNRTEMLKVSLASWLNFKEINQIIIVDWSSNDDLSFIKDLDKRIVYVRVIHENNFHLTLAYNTALEFVEYDTLLKLDVDIVLNPYYNLFETHTLGENDLYRGRWDLSQGEIRHKFLSYLVGTFYTKTANITRVKGYDTAFKNYGHDDTDLYRRLTETGIEIKFFEDNLSIMHIPHPDKKRSENYAIDYMPASCIMNMRDANRRRRMGIDYRDKMVIKKIDDNFYVARR